MPIGTASSRRPRSSVGQAQDFFIEGSSQQTVDVEFRRKHSRQNKEIITENVRHKTAIKVLNDEIGSLKEEIMEVKQINRILSLQMKKMKEDQKRSCSPATVQAIDALIAAMPALHVLKASLVPSSSPLPVFEAEVSRRNILRNIGISVGTRPANAGGNHLNLDTLGEEEEGEGGAEEEDGVVQQEGEGEIPKSVCGNGPARPITLSTSPKTTSGKSNMATPTKRLHIAPKGSPFSKAMPRSPLPPSHKTITTIVDSPTSSASSTPVKQASTTPKKKARRRRESGLVPPVPSASEETSPGAATTASTHNSYVLDHDRASEHIEEQAPFDNEFQSTLGESVSSSSTGTSALTSLSDLSFIADEGKRGRRSRISVNYKEPSLTKKMRKPDGVAIAEALGRRQSSGGLVGELSRPPSGVRRKSMLPNSLAKLSQPNSDGGSDLSDVDDIDACLTFDNMISSNRNRLKSPDSSSSGSTLSEPPSTLSSSHSSRNDIERVPTPIPPLHAEPHPVQVTDDGMSSPHLSASDHEDVIVAQSAPQRSSPRKASSAGTTQSTRNKARRSSVLPTKPPARAAPSTTGRTRTALADVPEPNSRTRTLPTTEPALKPRIGVSTRR